MIDGFEEYTHNLTYEEINIATLVKDYLHDNAGSFATNKQIADYLLKDEGRVVNGARMRKIINYIRCEIDNTPYVLIATSKGYKYTKNSNEIIAYEASLRQRYNAIRRVAYHINKSLVKATENKPEPIPPTSHQLNLFL